MSEENVDVIDEVVDDLTKEQKLEIARKKFADLKKKNKKKKSKSKDSKDSKEETPEIETEGDANDDEKEVEKSAESEPVEENTAKIEDKEVLTVDETEKQHEAKEQDKLAEANEPITEKEAIDGQKPDTKPLETKEDSTHENETKSKYTPKEVEAPKDTTTVPTPTIEELQKQILAQEKTIKKLRDENTDLKLSKMDLQDRITVLEEEVQQLESATPAGVPASSVPVKMPVAKPVYTLNEFASESRQDLTQFSTKGDFRENLMLWKGWQVDMTSWNSSVTTQQLRL